MAQRASPPLTTLFSRLAWSLQNGGVAVSLRAFSAMAIRGRVQTLGWQHGQRGAVAARGLCETLCVKLDATLRMSSE